MNSFVDTLQKLGAARLAVMGAVLLGLLIFFVFISMRVSTPSMKLLYSDLSTVDTSAIAAELEKQTIRYNVSNDGTRVMVPGTEIGRARMLLAEAGLPNGGSMGYELFDEQSGFGTTNFVQNINEKRALQGELSRTISSLEPIRNAEVLINLPKRELFSRESIQPSASVKIHIEPGNRLDKKQVYAIQSLVASAVPNLKANLVTIVDQNSNPLSIGDDSAEGAFTNNSQEMRQNMENRMRRNVEEIIGKIVGFGNVHATVSADLNFDRITTSEEIYDPNTVVRSTQVTEENNLEREGINDEVTAANNLPGGADNLLLDQEPTAENSRIEEVTNFEVSKTVRNKVSEIGEVKKLSVSVLVNGTYSTEVDEEGVETRVYEPRTQEQMDQIAALVRSAVGINEERGDVIEVVNQAFEDIDINAEYDDGKILGFETTEIKDLIEIMIITIAIVLVVLLVLRPMIGRLMEVPETRDEELELDMIAAQSIRPALEGPEGDEPTEEAAPNANDMIDMTKVEGQVKASSIKKVEDIVEAYPAETVSVIRSWMTQEST